MTTDIEEEIGDNASLVVEGLVRNRILTGEIAPGSWVRESHIAKELDVSRTPVREALSRIASDGLLKWTQRRGYLNPEFDPGELRTAYPVIIALEILAIESIGEDIPPLVAALNNCNAGVLHGEAVMSRYQADLDWHVRLVQAAGNEVLSELHERLLERIARYLFVYWQHRRDITRSSGEHELIIAALERGDVQLSVALLRSHRTMGLGRIEEILKLGAPSGLQN